MEYDSNVGIVIKNSLLTKEKPLPRKYIFTHIIIDITYNIYNQYIRCYAIYSILLHNKRKISSVYMGSTL